ncbi:MAG: molecular chaperone [Ottowia sp.]|nr:molecular chaperone [Ottowia sp.]
MQIQVNLKVLLLTTALVLGGLNGQTAFADLMINPTRIELDNKNASGQLELLNTGNQKTLYRVRLVNRRMTETGEFLPIDEKNPAVPGEHFADQLLRFSPPQITLLPGKSQIVRIALRRTEDVADGEYRSHLLFEQIPDTSDQGSIEALDTKNKKESKELSIKLTALFATTIPVLVRRGALTAKITLTDPTLIPATDDKPPLLSIMIHRQGERSAYGDLIVHYSPNDQGEPIPIGRVNGLAVYTPNEVRRATVTLHPPEPLHFNHGKLTVQFVSPIQEGAKPLAETNLSIH